MNNGILEISDVLTALLKQHHISEAEIARKIDVPRATINRLVSGRTPDPRASTLSAIAEYFSISVDQLMGKNPVFSQSSSAALGQNLPILTWEKVLHWENHTRLCDVTKDTDCISYDPSIQEGRFCLRVTSDAMTPQFQENSILIVNPTKVAVNRDYVIVHLIRTDEIIFRQLLIDGKYRCLKAINGLFPMIELHNDDRIVGVVIQGRNTF